MEQSPNEAIGTYLRSIRGKETRKEFILGRGAPKGANHWITEAALCRVERGQATPTLKTLTQIAQRAGISLRELFIVMADILDPGSHSTSEVPCEILEVYQGLLDHEEGFEYLIHQQEEAISLISQTGHDPWTTSGRLAQIHEGRAFPTIDDVFRMALANGYGGEDIAELFEEIGQRYGERAAEIMGEDF